MTTSKPVKLIVPYDPPPIPVRTHDWQLWMDDDPERGMLGNGLTQAAALVDFLTELEFHGFAENQIFSIEVCK